MTFAKRAKELSSYHCNFGTGTLTVDSAQASVGPFQLAIDSSGAPRP
jgi:hypothetical protein